MKGFNVYLRVATLKYLTKEDGKVFFTLMHNIVPEIQPEKVAMYEPYHEFHYDQLNEMVEDWPYKLSWIRRQNLYSYGNNVNGDYEDYNGIDVYVFVESEEFVERLTLFFKEVCKQFAAFYGIIAVGYETEMRDQELFNKYLCSFSWGVSVLEGLEPLCWGTYFGEPYVKLFGRDRLLSVPCKVEEVGHGFYIQLTEDMSSPDSDYAGYAQIRDKTIQHLGCNAFVQEGVIPNVPDLGYYTAFQLIRNRQEYLLTRLLHKSVLKEVEPGIYKRCTKEEEDAWFKSHYPQDELEFKISQRDTEYGDGRRLENFTAQHILDRIGDNLYKKGNYIPKPGDIFYCCNNSDVNYKATQVTAAAIETVPVRSSILKKTGKKYFDLKKQLKLLMENGIKFNDDKNTLNDMFGLYENEIDSYEKEKDGFMHLLYDIALNEDADNVMILDTECIHNIGDYKEILEKLNKITDNILKITDVRDSLTPQFNNEITTGLVSFKCNGTMREIAVKGEGDWVDTSLILTFIDMVETVNKDKLFFKLANDDQVIVLGYMSKHGVKKLLKGGLPIQALT